jgi:hypothetical protein
MGAGGSSVTGIFESVIAIRVGNMSSSPRRFAGDVPIE